MFGNLAVKMLGWLVFILIKYKTIFTKLFKERKVVPHLPVARRQLVLRPDDGTEGASFDLRKVCERVTECYPTEPDSLDSWWEVLICRAAGYGLGIYNEAGVSGCQSDEVMLQAIRRLLSHLRYKKSQLSPFRNCTETVADQYVKEWLISFEKALDSSSDIELIKASLLKSHKDGRVTTMHRALEVHGCNLRYDVQLKAVIARQYGGDELIEGLGDNDEADGAHALFGMLVYGSTYFETEPKLGADDILPRQHIIANEAPWWAFKNEKSKPAFYKNILSHRGCVLPSCKEDRELLFDYLGNKERLENEEERVAWNKRGGYTSAWISLMLCGYFKIIPGADTRGYAFLAKSRVEGKRYLNAPAGVPLDKLREYPSSLNVGVRYSTQGNTLHITGPGRQTLSGVRGQFLVG